MKKTILFILCMVCFSGFSHAQFLKKLANKIEKAAERTIERKVEQKTQRETEKAFDSTFNSKRNKKRKNSKNKSLISNIEPAESYRFNHKVEMQIKMNKDIINLDYFLTQSDDFLGLQMNDENIQGNFMNVLDLQKDAMFTFMDTEGLKTKIAINLETDNEALEVDSYDVKGRLFQVTSAKNSLLLVKI